MLHLTLLSLLACGVGARPAASEETMTTRAPSLDGSGDWAGLLGQSTPEDAARAALASVQPAVLLLPDSPEVTRLPPEARARVQPPTLGTTPEGEQLLAFWMGQPPGFGPVRVEVRVPASGPARVQRTPLGELLGEADREAALLRALEGGSRKEKQGAAKALGELGSVAAVPGLLALLQDPYAGARADAAAALARIAHPSAVAGLGEALSREADLAAGMQMITALAAIGGPEARQALAAAAAATPEPTLAMKAREAAAAP